MEIAEGIYKIDTALGERLSSIYLILGSNSAVLFDVGINGDSSNVIVPYMNSVGLEVDRVKYVVISHCDVDHFGGLRDAKQVFGKASVICHNADRGAITNFEEYLRVRGRGFLESYGFDEEPEVIAWEREVTAEDSVELGVTGGEVLDLGGRSVEIIHVPGHTRGHLVLWDAKTGTVLLSDAILWRAVVNADRSIAFPPTYRYVADYLHSIDRIERLHSRMLATAHYGVYEGERLSSFIEESKLFCLELETRVVRTIMKCRTGLTLDELITEVNDQAYGWDPRKTAKTMAFPVAGHVEHLISKGWVQTKREPRGAGRDSRVVIEWIR